MELLTLAAIIAGIIAVIIGLIVVIKKISAFYKQRFQFSIWSGVLLLVVALALLLISSADGTTQQTVYVMLVIAAILALLTIHLSFAAVQDRQLQGVVLIGNASSDKLDLCPIHIAQTHIADSAHIGGIGILLSDNFPEFLFVKSHCLHLIFR